MTGTTQPPAGTLARPGKIDPCEYCFGVTRHDANCRALTRRAGVDAIPAEMTREERRLEDLKQMAAYAGPVVSFDVRDPYYLASCDGCGWVGSSEACGTDEADDVFCPRCHRSGADCGKIATRVGGAAKPIAKPDYEPAWREMYDALSWMQGNRELHGYWGLNLAVIANDLIDRAYPGLRDGKALPSDHGLAINRFTLDVHAAQVAAGWWSNLETGEPIKRNVGELLCLVHSEISEAMEGHRKSLMDDKLPHRPMIEVELADAIIRIADLAGGLNLDLGGAITEKMAYNAKREDHKLEVRRAAGGKAY